MGFYNIFRMFRLILKDILGYKNFRKILIIILLIFICFFIYTKCYAYGPFTINGLTFNFTSSSWDTSAPNANYFTVLRYNSGSSQYYYVCLKTEAPVYINNHPDGTYTQVDITSSNNGTDTYFTAERKAFNKTATTITISSSSSGTIYSFSTRYSTFTPNSLDVFYSDTKVYLNNNEIYNPYKAPSLSNTQTELENLNFNNFIINANSYTEELENNDGTLFMLFYNRSLTNSQTTDGLYPIKEKAFTKGSIYTDYENSTSDNMIFSYPIFNSGVFFNIGSTYEIRFAKQVYNSEYNINTYEYLGDPIQFTVSSNVTQDYINQLNQQTATSTDNEATQDLQNSINNQTNAINNQTQSIDNINNSITNSSVDNSSINLPTDNTNDPTQSGIDNIFQTIYNSFTSGTPQDIIFPIPNTDKNITLSANYTYNSLQNNNATWVITITQAFWWYLISRFIITDIMQKVRKIKQGNLENIENSNIKEDML